MMTTQLDRIEAAQARIEAKQQALDAKLEALLAILAEEADDDFAEGGLDDVPRERNQHEPL